MKIRWGIMLVIILAAALPKSRAAVVVWDCNGGAGGHKWSYACNWDNDIGPALSDDVTFGTEGDDVHLDLNTTVGLIRFNSSGDFKIKNEGGHKDTLSINTGVSTMGVGREFVIEVKTDLAASQVWNTDTGSQLTLKGEISESAAILKTGDGTVLINGNKNTFTGAMTLRAGTLILDKKNTMSNNNDFIMDGGTLQTGIVSGKDQDNLGKLTLTSNSTIVLGKGRHDIRFDDSSGMAWAPGTILTITGWTDTPGMTGAGGRIYMGDGTGMGLTPTQLLAQVQFSGYALGAMILSDGEMVPISAAVPEASTWFSIGCLMLVIIGDVIRRKKMHPGATFLKNFIPVKSQVVHRDQFLAYFME